MKLEHLLIISLISVVLLIGANGCGSDVQDNQKGILGDNERFVETISINGIDKHQEVSNVNPVKLVISGQRVTIDVKEGTIVDEIVISGIDISINLQEGSSPKITDSGIRTKINYSTSVES
ncbi:MAG: hypothetical protein KJ767_01990, partial [Nanoarchaeota archaeon]|nr:hypothetical protein [Nanoarchaeota archaeon]